MSTSAQPAKKRSLPGWVWLGLVMVFLFLSFRSCLSGGEDRPDTQADYAERAKYACREAIKDRLKAPSTAKFGVLTTTGFGSTGDYAVTGSVDSENSFGAKVRAGVVCEMNFIGGQPDRIRAQLVE